MVVASLCRRDGNLAFLQSSDRGTRNGHHAGIVAVKGEGRKSGIGKDRQLEGLVHGFVWQGLEEKFLFAAESRQKHLVGVIIGQLVNKTPLVSEITFDFLSSGLGHHMIVSHDLRQITDQVVAHLDHEHLVYAKHPIIDQERTYFALQVDQAGAAFDNLQVFEASRHPDRVANLAHVEKATGRFPVKKSIREEHEIRKRNLHARFHLDDPAYRKLVEEVDRLDAEKVERFPEVFSSHKSFQKKIQKLRKKLHQEDPVYKETLFATFRANRAMEQYLFEKDPSIEKQPDTRKKAALERARAKHQGDDDYKKLVTAAEDAQKKLESDYPQLFVSNEEITEKRNQARKALKKDETFKKLTDARAAAYRDQQDYLYQNDEKLAQLKERLDQEKKKR